MFYVYFFPTHDHEQNESAKDREVINDLFALLLNKDLGLDTTVCNIQQPTDFIHENEDLDRLACVFEDIVYKCMEKLDCVEDQKVGALKEVLLKTIDHLVKDQHM